MVAALKYIGIAIMIILDIVIIVAVLMQSSKSSGLSGLVSGASETFFGKNKGEDMDAKLEKIVKIAGIAFVIVSVLLTMLINRWA